MRAFDLRIPRDKLNHVSWKLVRLSLSLDRRAVENIMLKGTEVLKRNQKFFHNRKLDHLMPTEMRYYRRRVERKFQDRAGYAIS
jgi:hypothetical protein